RQHLTDKMLSAAGRQSELSISVEGRICGVHCSSNPSTGHARQNSCVRPIKRCVGSDQRQGCVSLPIESVRQVRTARLQGRELFFAHQATDLFLEGLAPLKEQATACREPCGMAVEGPLHLLARHLVELACE